MAPTSIELKIMYAQDLKSFNFFQKLSVYVLVSIEMDGMRQNHGKKHRQRTPTDTEGDGNPEWNHEMHFDLSEFALDRVFLHFDLRHHAQLLGDRTIGEVRVPVKDLMEEEEVSTNGVARFVSYQVRSPDGKPNGLIHFSCRFVNTTCTTSHQLHPHPTTANTLYSTSEVDQSYQAPQTLAGGYYNHNANYPYPYYPLPPPPPAPLLHQPTFPPPPPRPYHQPPYPPVFPPGPPPGVYHDYRMSRNW